MKDRIPHVFLSLFTALLLSVLAVAIPFGGFWGIQVLNQKHNESQADKIVLPKAEAYLVEQYADLDLEITDCYWSWYDNCYHVKVSSKASQDTYFTLSYSTKGKELISDNYAQKVLGRQNTLNRIQEAYTVMVEQAISRMENPTARICYCYLRKPSFEDWSELELDKTYDTAEIREIGRQYADISIELEESKDNLNLDCALEYLTELDRLLEGNGASYKVMEITLWVKEGTETSKWNIYDITHEDLTCENPHAVLQEKWEQQETYRQELYASWHKN